jgi:hypothetical protein
VARTSATSIAPSEGVTVLTNNYESLSESFGFGIASLTRRACWALLKGNPNCWVVGRCYGNSGVAGKDGFA